MKQLMYCLALVFAVVVTVLSTSRVAAQVSVYTDVGTVVEQNKSDETRSFLAGDYGQVGVSWQYYTNDNLHHLEAKASWRFDQYKGPYADIGYYVNVIPILRGPRRNARWLAGAGLGYDGYQQLTDYFADTRLSVNYELVQFSLGAKVNLIEAHNFGATPELYMRMQFHFYTPQYNRHIENTDLGFSY